MNRSPSHKMTYSNIDWNELWQNAREQKSWNSKKPSDWDQKAASFSKRNKNSPYVSLFLAKLPLDPSMSVLDVGCGPGTLAIPLAKQVTSVTCIDYSQAMLELVEKRALDNGLHTIRTVNCSWEDDWKQHGVEPHDITISSRSIGVGDLHGALTKLNAYAKRFVFVTDRISPTPFDPEAFAAVGRDFNAGPDYIYTVNCLYSMGIHPSVNILQLDKNFTFTTMADAVDSYSWMFQELSPVEERKLEAYVQSRVVDSDDQQIVVRRKHPPRWAMIWWEKE